MGLRRDGRSLRGGLEYAHGRAAARCAVVQSPGPPAQHSILSCWSARPYQSSTQHRKPSPSAVRLAPGRLEEVFLVYTAEKNRGLTLRLHYLLAAAWAVGALKTVSQAAHTYRT